MGLLQTILKTAQNEARGAGQAASAVAHGNLGQAGQIAAHMLTNQPVDQNASHAAANNTTKIPYNNGFYAGAYQPNRVDPNNIQQPQLMKQLFNVVAPHLAADPGMTDLTAQGGEENPGYIPLQGSMGSGAYPQIGAFGGVQRPGDQFDPQHGFYY